MTYPASTSVSLFIPTTDSSALSRSVDALATSLHKHKHHKLRYNQQLNSISREGVTRVRHARVRRGQCQNNVNLKHLQSFKIKVPCTKRGTINSHLLIVHFTSYRFGKNKEMISSIAGKHFQSCLLKRETIITHRINRANLVLQGTFLVFHIELELRFLKKYSNTARNVAI